MSDATSSIQELPEIIKQTIFSKLLNKEDLHNARLVCKNWYENITELLKDPEFIRDALIKLYQGKNLLPQQLLDKLGCNKSIVKKAIDVGFSLDIALEPWLSATCYSFIDNSFVDKINLLKTVVANKTFDTYSSAINTLKFMTEPQLIAMHHGINYNLIVGKDSVKYFSREHVAAAIHLMAKGMSDKYAIDEISHFSITHVEGIAADIPYNVIRLFPSNFNWSHMEALKKIKTSKAIEYMAALDLTQFLTEIQMQSILQDIPYDVTLLFPSNFNEGHVEALETLRITKSIGYMAALELVMPLTETQTQGIVLDVPYEVVQLFPSNFNWNHIKALKKIKTTKAIEYMAALDFVKSLTATQVQEINYSPHRFFDEFPEPILCRLYGLKKGATRQQLEYIRIIKHKKFNRAKISFNVTYHF